MGFYSAHQNFQLSLLSLFVDNISKEEINIHPITKVNEQHEENSRDYRDHKTF